MAITVTTRSAKGSELTTSEMDDNLTSLARSATTSQEGNIQIANQAETNSLSSTTRAVVPGYLQETVENIISNDSQIAEPGYYTLPGGFKIQWGKHSMDGGSDEQSVMFPDPFDSSCWVVVMTNFEDAAGSDLGNIARVREKDTSGFTYVNTGGNTFTEWMWIAIGS